MQNSFCQFQYENSFLQKPENVRFSQNLVIFTFFWVAFLWCVGEGEPLNCLFRDSPFPEEHMFTEISRRGF